MAFMGLALFLLVVLALAVRHSPQSTPRQKRLDIEVRVVHRPTGRRPASRTAEALPSEPWVRDDAGEPIAARRGPRPHQCQRCGWFSADVAQRQDGRQVCDACAAEDGQNSAD